MWGLAHHRGLWGMFRENGGSTSTPFLHLQGFDFLKDPQMSVLASPHVPFWSLPLPPVCPRVWLESLVNKQGFTISPKCCWPRGCPSLSSERLCEAEGRCQPCRRAWGLLMEQCMGTEP